MTTESSLGTSLDSEKRKRRVNEERIFPDPSSQKIQFQHDDKLDIEVASQVSNGSRNSTSSQRMKGILARGSQRRIKENKKVEEYAFSHPEALSHLAEGSAEKSDQGLVFHRSEENIFNEKVYKSVSFSLPPTNGPDKIRALEARLEREERERLQLQKALDERSMNIQAQIDRIKELESIVLKHQDQTGISNEEEGDTYKNIDGDDHSISEKETGKLTEIQKLLYSVDKKLVVEELEDTDCDIINQSVVDEVDSDVDDIVYEDERSISEQEIEELEETLTTSYQPVPMRLHGVDMESKIGRVEDSAHEVFRKRNEIGNIADGCNYECKPLIPGQEKMKEVGTETASCRSTMTHFQDAHLGGSAEKEEDNACAINKQINTRDECYTFNQTMSDEARSFSFMAISSANHSPPSSPKRKESTQSSKIDSNVFNRNAGIGMVALPGISVPPPVIRMTGTSSVSSQNFRNEDYQVPIATSSGLPTKVINNPREDQSSDDADSLPYLPQTYNKQSRYANDVCDDDCTVSSSSSFFSARSLGSGFFSDEDSQEGRKVELDGPGKKGHQPGMFTGSNPFPKYLEFPPLGKVNEEKVISVYIDDNKTNVYVSNDKESQNITTNSSQSTMSPSCENSNASDFSPIAEACQFKDDDSNAKWNLQRQDLKHRRINTLLSKSIFVKKQGPKEINDCQSELDFLLCRAKDLNRIAIGDVKKGASVDFNVPDAWNGPDVQLPFEKATELVSYSNDIHRRSVSAGPILVTSTFESDDVKDASKPILKYIGDDPSSRDLKIRPCLLEDDYDTYFNEIYSSLLRDRYRTDSKKRVKFVNKLLQKRPEMSREVSELDNKKNIKARTKTLEDVSVSVLISKYQFPPGLAKWVHRVSKHMLPFRIWIVDNSGSMATADGQRFLDGSIGNKKKLSKNKSKGAGHVSQLVSCTRWEELRENVLFHAELAADLGVPTVFRLVNDPNIARRQRRMLEGLNEDEYDLIPQVFGICVRRRVTSRVKIDSEKKTGKSYNLRSKVKKFVHVPHQFTSEKDEHVEPKKDWEGEWEVDLGCEDASDPNWNARAINDFHQLNYVMHEVEPRYQTPLAGHMLSIVDQIQEMKPFLKKDQKVAIVIATDGLPDDKNNFLYSIEELRKLPVYIIVRLCTDDDAAMHFWNTLDLDVNLEIEILDDFEAEASNVNSMNPWFNYCIPVQNMREWGYRNPLIEKLREKPLSYDELRELCALVFGISASNLPHPKKDWDTFYYDVKSLLNRESKQWNPLSQRPERWINLKKMAQAYGGKREKARKRKIRKLLHERKKYEEARAAERERRKRGTGTKTGEQTKPSRKAFFSRK